MAAPSSSGAAADLFAARCARLGPVLMRELALTDVQAAGLLGNLGYETGGFRHLQEIAPLVPGSRGGWGLAQWTGPRRMAMEAWSRARGLDPASDAANEGYLIAELRGPESAALDALRRCATLDRATETVCRLFERPAIPALPHRLAYARRALRAIRPTPVPHPPGGPHDPRPARPRPALRRRPRRRGLAGDRRPSLG
ncbi:phage tail tip lysozyme [Methylobacterium sp. J-067]|uniref:phage tail tip lysozyme n=1 Tax=Methylobacterium sp. J-067 TaxID=2836648 RepID=UPI001FBB1EA9|nr:phage tail tip lysozyme [Methylobacterium sp. J-067]MCJ2027528.1 phage tail tip lysozyme [Methylobacterium sp. J-067]